MMRGVNWHNILKLMVAYAYAMDKDLENDLPNEDRKFILAMWYYYVCSNPKYIKAYGTSVPLTATKMRRMNRLWQRLGKYYHDHPNYPIDAKYSKTVAVYPMD